LLITNIRNGHQVTTVTTTSHQSREMPVSLGPQGTLVTAPKQSPLQKLDIGDACCVLASSLSRRNETRLFHTRLSTTRIRNGHQSTTVTTISHRSRELSVSLGPQGTLVTGTKTEPVTVNSISETRVVNMFLLCLDERASSWGPLVSIGNEILCYSLNYWHVCNGSSE
jgi:hypothetical protein